MKKHDYIIVAETRLELMTLHVHSMEEAKRDIRALEDMGIACSIHHFVYDDIETECIESIYGRLYTEKYN